MRIYFRWGGCTRMMRLKNHGRYALVVDPKAKLSLSRLRFQDGIIIPCDPKYLAFIENPESIKAAYEKKEVA